MLSLLCAMTMTAWAQTTLINYPTSEDGIIACGSTLKTTVKIHMNKDAVSCYQLKNGYNSNGTSNGNHILLSVEDGFKKGDILTIAGTINNDDETKWGTAVLFTMDAELNVSVIYDGFANFINSRLVNDDPVEESYTLTEDYDELYLGRNGNTGANVTLIKVVRPADETKENVTMSFPEESYSVMEGTTFEAPELTVLPVVSPITFSSSNEDVAMVDENTGEVEIKAQGTTTITASFGGNDTYNPASASYTLNVTKNYHGTLLIDYPNSKDGIFISGTTEEGTVKIHTNTDAIDGIGLKNGYSSGTTMNGNHIKLEVEGGFKKGDVLTIAGAYNNSAEKESSVALFTSLDGETATVIKDDFAQFINGRLVNDDPVEQTYSLEDDYDVLYLGRNGNTTTYLTLITMVRPNNVEPAPVERTYSLVSEPEDLTSGKYLIVWDNNSTYNAFDGSLETLEGVGNYQEVEISGDNEIVTDKPIYFTIDVEAGTVQSASGYYIGVTSNSVGLVGQSESADAFNNNIFVNSLGLGQIDADFEGSVMSLRFRFKSGDHRFGFYDKTNGNLNTSPIQLYKEVVEEPEVVPVTISASGKATLYYAEKTLKVAEGVTAYTAVKGASTITLTALEDGIIPAGVPVVVSGTEGSYEFEVMPNSTASFEGQNDLVGVEVDTKDEEAGYKYYVLSWKNKNKLPEEVGFYWQSGSKGMWASVKAHQAYLKVAEGVAPTDANGFSFTFDETTGIATVDSDSTLDMNTPMYNLAGQRVGKDYRGVVIQNGMKKVKR